MDLLKRGPVCSMCWSPVRWPEYACNQCGAPHLESTNPALEECECGGNYEPPSMCRSCAAIGETLRKARATHG